MLSKINYSMQLCCQNEILRKNFCKYIKNNKWPTSVLHWDWEQCGVSIEHASCYATMPVLGQVVMKNAMWPFHCVSFCSLRHYAPRRHCETRPLRALSSFCTYGHARFQLATLGHVFLLSRMNEMPLDCFANLAARQLPRRCLRCVPTSDFQS